MAKQIENEFKIWIKKFMSGEVTICAEQVEDNGQLVWYVDLYNEDGKDFFKYLGNGEFQFAGSKN
jgi:hypothetical protein